MKKLFIVLVSSAYCYGMADVASPTTEALSLSPRGNTATLHSKPPVKPSTQPEVIITVNQEPQVPVEKPVPPVTVEIKTDTSDTKTVQMPEAVPPVSNSGTSENAAPQGTAPVDAKAAPATSNVQEAKNQQFSQKLPAKPSSLFYGLAATGSFGALFYYLIVKPLKEVQAAKAKQVQAEKAKQALAA